jgi:hypothetical protein
MNIDAYCVALDETDHYVIADEDKPKIEKIMGVYLFDKNEVTHCCELTPSYWLIHLYDEVVCAKEVDDEERSRLDEEYGHEDAEDIYVHCRDIERIIEKAERWTVLHHGDPELPDDEDKTDEENHRDKMEALREHFCGNCPF